MSARQRRPQESATAGRPPAVAGVEQTGNADYPWDRFDSEAYLRHNYGNLHELDRAIIGKLGAFFGSVAPPQPTWRGIDVGPGANLYPLLAMLPLTSQVTLWEHSLSNRQWLDQELRRYGQAWDPFWEELMASADLYRRYPRPGAELTARVELEKGSIFDLPEARFDIGTMFFVAESITAVREEFEQAALRFIGALRPGAPFAAAFVRNSEGYQVGTQRFPAVAVTEQDIQELLREVADLASVDVIGSTDRFREGYDGMVLVTGHRAADAVPATAARDAIAPGHTDRDRSHLAADTLASPPGAAGEVAGRSVGPAVHPITEKVFTTYDVQSCLFDTERVDYLWSAIKRTVRPGDVVVDAGSGTGLLGLLAARQGAARVYCLEVNPEFIEVIEQHARRNQLADQIIAVPADATTYTPVEEVDVLISEVISGGFFYEPQLQILNNLHRYLRPGGRVVPMAMSNHLELISAQDTLYGLRFDYDSRFNELEQDRSLSTTACYLRSDFHTYNSPEIDGRVRVTATDSAVANALRVSYDIDFADGVSADRPTQFLLNPQVIYLPEPVPVVVGQEYELRLAYRASDSPLRAQIEVRAVG